MSYGCERAIDLVIALSVQKVELSYTLRNTWLDTYLCRGRSWVTIGLPWLLSFLHGLWWPRHTYFQSHGAKCGRLWLMKVREPLIWSLHWVFRKFTWVRHLETHD